MCHRAIGSGSLGMEGNHQGVSYGGRLVRELLDGDRKEYFLVNGLKETEGGPWTWVSRADSRVKSCIDLVIVSANLRPYVSKLTIDSMQKFCPKKVGMSKGKENIIRSDHYPMMLELKNMPKARKIVKKRKPVELEEARWMGVI